MDNNSPDYAKWIPEAKGYVYNGKVVSQTPLYDNTGRARIEVGMNEIQTPQTPTVQAPTQQAPTVMADVGQSFNIGGQSNQAGSGTDMNAAATAIGSMAALNTNTARSNTGTLGSPALQSNIANVEPLDPRDKVLKDYEYMVATNNLQGQINALTELQTIDGVDYSAQIQDLQQQRAQKIKTQDDTYSNLISYYSSIGRDDLVNQYVAERNAYRNKVGYQDMITQEYNQERQTIQDDFVFAYQTGLNDINNAILASVGELVNFQYDPTTDRALHVAQGYAVGQVKEQMNHTGMYYSSMTQNAITRAIAELVPVYEKMARDEIKENISMMMNIGNYLMNLEQDQFNMWKTRIQLKYQENEDRRAEIQQAWQRANYLGYVDNAASTILGIPAGTLSPNARQQMIELQQEKDKEKRSLDIQKRLADYQQGLAIKKMQEEERLNEKYWNYQVNNPKPTSTGSSGSTDNTKLPGSFKAAKLVELYNSLMKANTYDLSKPEDQDKLYMTLYNAADTTEDLQQALLDINNGDTNKESVDTIVKRLNSSAGAQKPSEILGSAINYSNKDQTRLAEILGGITYAKSDDSLLGGQNMFNVNYLSNMGKDAYGTYVDFYAENDGDKKDMVKNASKLMTRIDQLLPSGNITQEQYGVLVDKLAEDTISKIISDAEDKYGKDTDKTNKAVKDALASVEKYVDAVRNSSLSAKDTATVAPYLDLIQSIVDADDSTFDYNGLPGNTGIKSKTEAVANIVASVKNNKNYGENSENRVYSTIKKYAEGLAESGKINKLSSAWFAGM